MVVALSELETNGSLKLSGLHVESAFDYVFSLFKAQYGITMELMAQEVWSVKCNIRQVKE